MIAGHRGSNGFFLRQSMKISLRSFTIACSSVVKLSIKPLVNSDSWAVVPRALSDLLIDDLGLGESRVSFSASPESVSWKWDFVLRLSGTSDGRCITVVEQAHIVYVLGVSRKLSCYVLGLENILLYLSSTDTDIYSRLICLNNTPFPRLHVTFCDYLSYSSHFSFRCYWHCWLENGAGKPKKLKTTDRLITLLSALRCQWLK